MNPGSVKVLWALGFLFWMAGSAAAACDKEDRQGLTSERKAAVLAHFLKDGGDSVARAVRENRTGQSGPKDMSISVDTRSTQTGLEQEQGRLSDVESTYAGYRLSVYLLLHAAYDAGFRSEDALLTAVAVSISESSLWTAARNWKPEYGYRPASDEIGVRGPRRVWAKDNRQMHSDRGLWQLSSYWWPEFTDSVADDPVAAAEAAFVLSDSGTNFCLWDSYAHGNAQRHYDQAYKDWPPLRPIVEAFLSQEAAQAEGSSSDTDAPGYQ